MSWEHNATLIYHNETFSFIASWDENPANVASWASMSLKLGHENIFCKPLAFSFWNSSLQNRQNPVLGQVHIERYCNSYLQS